jgi:hypothetical protein
MHMRKHAVTRAMGLPDTRQAHTLRLTPPCLLGHEIEATIVVDTPTLKPVKAPAKGDEEHKRNSPRQQQPQQKHLKEIHPARDRRVDQDDINMNIIHGL